MTIKEEFEEELKESVGLIHEYISTEDRQWTIKGCIDVFQNSTQFPLIQRLFK